MSIYITIKTNIKINIIIYGYDKLEKYMTKTIVKPLGVFYTSLRYSNN